MSTETCLQDLASSARQLLDCEQVSLCLHCPEATLRHPLIALFFQIQTFPLLYYGSLLDPTFLCNEDLWALCDIALLSGQSIMEGAQLKRVRERHKAIGSVMIALLERPAGIVGFLFCTSRQADAFREGERRLLAQYAPELARQVERVISKSCLAASVHADGENIATGIQEQSAFLSLISHELRAPLTAIKGYAGLLQEYGSSVMDEGQPGRMSGAQQRCYLDVIMEQVNHLEVLVGDVLDVSHIQSGRLALRCTPIDLGQLCQHVVQLMQYRVERQQPGRYSLLCTIDPQLPPVWADGDRVQQILTNLLENAIKYSPHGGLIEIRVRTSANCSRKCTCKFGAEESFVLGACISPAFPFACVTVSDQGIGIPRQQQSSLFKPFKRLEHPATGHVSGTGLGLYIARKLVEAMQGQVHLRSSEGRGTDITFTLPVAQSVETLSSAHPGGRLFFQSASTR